MTLNRYSRETRLLIYSGMFLGWILLVFLFTYNRAWLQDWGRWDASWYARIWHEGYPASDPRALVFPPGYSLVVGPFATVLSTSFLGVAIALNLGAFWGTAVLLSEWLSQKFGINPFLTFAFTLSAPAGYFAFTSYSDVLFMLLLWVVLWFSLAKNDRSTPKQLILQSSLLLVIPWVRLTGYALLSWLAVKRVAAIAVLASFALWMGLNYWIAGSPFYFLDAQKLFLMPDGNLLEGLSRSFDQATHVDFHAGMNTWLQFGLLPMFYLAALAATAVWLLRKREGLLGITVLSILLVSHNQSFWRSVVRYDLPLIPVLCIPLLVWAGSRSRIISRLSLGAFALLLAGQFAAQLYFARIFHSGGWAF